MMKYTYIRSIGALVLGTLSLLSASATNYYTHANDTISRELVLQREYVPEGKQAQKAYFTPLDRSGTQGLKPIEFVRDRFGVSMNVYPQLFTPVANPLHPTVSKERASIRIFGGFPYRYGVDAGVLTPVGDLGTLQFSARHHYHADKKVPRPEGLPFQPHNLMRDTKVGATYTHTLEERTLAVSGSFFHHQNSFYGQQLQAGSTPPPAEQHFSAAFPLYSLWGAELGAELSPAPLAMASYWQYALSAHLAFARKDEPLLRNTGQFVQDADLNGYTPTNSNRLNELSGRIAGNIAYSPRGEAWSFGANASYSFLGPLSINPELDTPGPQVLSVDPYLQYQLPRFSAKLGARLQLLNKGDKKFLLTPDVQLRWQPFEKVSLIAEATGGATTYRMRDLYEQNRYALGLSSLTGFDIADYCLHFTIQMGNFYGFSAEVKGGFEHYRTFSDWQMHLVPSLRIDNPKSHPFNINTPVYQLVNQGEVGIPFIEIAARYLTPFGLELAGKVKHAKYDGTSHLDANHHLLPIAGHPSLTMAFNARYQITKQLALQAEFMGEMGKVFLVPTATPYLFSQVELPMAHQLNATLSYKVHDRLGISVIGNNLLNTRSARWLYYHQPGTSVMLGATISI